MSIFQAQRNFDCILDSFHAGCIKFSHEPDQAITCRDGPYLFTKGHRVFGQTTYTFLEFHMAWVQSIQVNSTCERDTYHHQCSVIVDDDMIQRIAADNDHWT